MKRFFAVFCALVLLTACCAPVFAAGTMTVSAGSVKAPLNGTAEVPVTLSGNPGIVTLLFRVRYDREKLELVGIRDGGILGTDTEHDLKEGILFWKNFTHEDDFFENGTICTLLFRVKSGEEGEEIPVILEKTDEKYPAMNMGLENVPFEVAPGSVTVEGAEAAPFPWQAWLFTAAGVVLAGGCAAFLAVRSAKKKKEGAREK